MCVLLITQHLPPIAKSQDVDSKPQMTLQQTRVTTAPGAQHPGRLFEAGQCAHWELESGAGAGIQGLGFVLQAEGASGKEAVQVKGRDVAWEVICWEALR